MSSIPRRTPPTPAPATEGRAERPDEPGAAEEQPGQGTPGELAARIGEAVRAAHAEFVPF